MLLKDIIQDNLSNETKSTQGSKSREIDITDVKTDYFKVIGKIKRKIDKEIIKSNDDTHILEELISNEALFLFGKIARAGYQPNLVSVTYDDFTDKSFINNSEVNFLPISTLATKFGRDALISKLDYKKAIINDEVITLEEYIEPLKEFFDNTSDLLLNELFKNPDVVDSVSSDTIISLLAQTRTNLVVSIDNDNIALVTENVWEEFQILTREFLIDNSSRGIAKFRNIIESLYTLNTLNTRNTLVSKAFDLNEKFTKFTTNIINTIVENQIHLSNSNLEVLYPIAKASANKIFKSSSVYVHNSKEDQLKYSTKARNFQSASVILTHKLNHIIRQRKISKVSKSDIDDSMRHFSPSKNSIISEIVRLSDTKVEVKFKEPLAPYKIKYGNKYYLLTEEAKANIKPSIKVKNIIIDFGTINGKYPVCKVPNSDHPNISGGSDGTVCLGTIKEFENATNTVKGIPFPPFSELINMLSMINFDSAYRFQGSHHRIFKREFDVDWEQCNCWSERIITKFNPSIDSYLEDLLDLED